MISSAREVELQKLDDFVEIKRKIHDEDVFHFGSH